MHPNDDIRRAEQQAARAKQIDDAAIMLAKLYSSARDYPFWGNEVERFRTVVKELTDNVPPTRLCLIDTNQPGWPVVWTMPN